MDKARPKTVESVRPAPHGKEKSPHNRSASSYDLPSSKKNNAAPILRDVEVTVGHAKLTNKNRLKNNSKKHQQQPTQTTTPVNIPLEPVPTPTPTPLPTTSVAPQPILRDATIAPPAANSTPPDKPWWSFCYDRQKKTYCGRTCVNWGLIIAYAIMYMIFLSTYTLIFLYASLRLVSISDSEMSSKKSELYAFENNGIGLTATPTSRFSYPLVWYRTGNKKDFEPYVNSIDTLLGNIRRKRDVSQLGPCGTSPFGYGESPCVVVRANKQIAWAGKPLKPGSKLAKSAPPEVQELLKRDKQKLWFHCNGYYPWDQEHIGEIKYYPDPPGFDPDLFPLNMSSSAPLLALQLTKFTLGISIAVECKLWYDEGPSSFHFILYVEPEPARKNYDADFT